MHFTLFPLFIICLHYTTMYAKYAYVLNYALNVFYTHIYDKPAYKY